MRQHLGRRRPPQDLQESDLHWHRKGMRRFVIISARNLPIPIPGADVVPPWGVVPIPHPSQPVREPRREIGGLPTAPEGLVSGSVAPLDHRELDAAQSGSPHPGLAPQPQGHAERDPELRTIGGPAFEALLAPGGVERIVAWGEFGPMLQDQVARPDRLRPRHRLRCRVEAYQATTPIRVAALADDIARRTGLRVRLSRLTEAHVQRLDLRDLLTPVPQLAAPAWKERDLALPFERFFRVVLRLDPTRTDQQRPHPAPNGVFPTATAAPARPHTRRPHGMSKGVSRVGRTDGLALIPERFRAPWEWKSSREEAQLAMALEGKGFRALLRPFQRVWRSITRRSRHWKWEALRAGRTLEEQLWAVRPPPGGYREEAVKAWVREALSSQGIDPGVGLREWEVFWRRKGV